MQSYPYPCEGMQHTRALVALGIIDVCIEHWGNEDIPKGTIKRLANIRRHHDECCKQTRRRAMSQGTKRAVYAYAEIMEHHLITEEMTPHERAVQWLHIFWIGIQFIDEVRTTCPIYWNGKKRKSWQLLQRTTENLAKSLDKLWPEAQERFAPIYLEISDAMEAA